MSGLSRTPGKRVGVHSPPRVRIPLSPPNASAPKGAFAFGGESVDSEPAPGSLETVRWTVSDVARLCAMGRSFAEA
jgi:hypothetical protein